MINICLQSKSMKRCFKAMKSEINSEVFEAKWLFSNLFIVYHLILAVHVIIASA
ncbi:hypothetical protein LguiB_004648 [Lonicera macranthoides]